METERIISQIIVNHLDGRIKDYIFGFAQLKGLLKGKYSDFSGGIVIGRRLENEIINSIENGPTIEYFHYYKKVNSELSSLAHYVENCLFKEGIECSVFEPTFSVEMNSDAGYLKTLSLDISHKMLGTRAGLGWIGKTDLFVSKLFGPRIRLVSILTKQSLKSLSPPVNKSKCGNCNICVEKCPAKAANGKLWNINVFRDVFFDPHKCRIKCGEFAKTKLNIDARICGICVSVCPIGQKSKSEYFSP